MLTTLFRTLRKSEHGQDVAEYCLITALIALVACGIFYHVSGGMQNLWSTANTTLTADAPRGDAPNAPASVPSQ